MKKMKVDWNEKMPKYGSSEKENETGQGRVKESVGSRRGRQTMKRKTKAETERQHETGPGRTGVNSHGWTVTAGEREKLMELIREVESTE